MKKVTNKVLQYFGPRYFNIIGREVITRTVFHKIPYETGYYNGEFPKYLAGFEHYYEERHRENWWSSGHTSYWHIKPEYEDNRPQYSISVTYVECEVEFTEKGKKEIERRYNIHKRNLEKYARLMG